MADETGKVNLRPGDRVIESQGPLIVGDAVSGKQILDVLRNIQANTSVIANYAIDEIRNINPCGERMQADPESLKKLGIRPGSDEEVIVWAVDEFLKYYKGKHNTHKDL